jgi:hypothetical protein
MHDADAYGRTRVTPVVGEDHAASPLDTLRRGCCWEQDSRHVRFRTPDDREIEVGIDRTDARPDALAARQGPARPLGVHVFR